MRPNTHELTWLQTFFTSLLALLLGSFLIFASTLFPSDLDPKWAWAPLILTNLGALLVASVAVSILWGLYAKRGFLQEVMERVELSKDLASAGIVGTPRHFYDDVDWGDLFNRAESVDLFFGYAATWRGVNDQYLQTLARNPGSKTRILLPDPESDLVVQSLAGIWNLDSESIRNRIEAAKAEICELYERCGAHERLHVWYLDATPVYSSYIFDGRGVLALQKYQRGRGEVPVFEFDEAGYLSGFLRSEFESLVAETESRTRLVYPEGL